MTVLMECENISKEYGERIILDKINFKVSLGERLGIVGDNGAGKTTLANILSGRIEADDGKVVWYKQGVTIGYMKQATEYEELKDTLSGGERTRKLLTEVLYGKYNFIILDEPTNHLDYAGVEWLIKEISKYKGTILIISHDRYFLDQTVNRVVEIENKRITNYNGNYSWYRQIKRKEYEDSLNLYIQQEKVKERITGQITELKQWSSKAHREAARKAVESGNKKGGKQFNRAKAKRMDARIKSQIKRLEKIEVEGVEKPKEEAEIVFKINKAAKIGAVVVQVEDISKSFGKKVLFNKSSFYIRHSEKIGIYGPNGCGKSTLIKAMLGLNDVEGELKINKSRKIGYISQDVIDLNDEATVLELFSVDNREQLGELRTELFLMGFASESLNKKIAVLSLGERMKLKLLLMIREKCDILILDEPTNHIDLHVREQLEEALAKYNGTIILVTHDRYMLEKICNKLLIFENKSIKRCEYGFAEYLDKKKEQAENNANKKLAEEKIILDNKLAYIIGQLSTLNKESQEYKKLAEEYTEILKLKRIYS